VFDFVLTEFWSGEMMAHCTPSRSLFTDSLLCCYIVAKYCEDEKYHNKWKGLYTSEMN